MNAVTNNITHYNTKNPVETMKRILAIVTINIALLNCYCAPPKSLFHDNYSDAIHKAVFTYYFYHTKGHKTYEIDKCLIINNKDEISQLRNLYGPKRTRVPVVPIDMQLEFYSKDNSLLFRDLIRTNFNLVVVYKKGGYIYKDLNYEVFELSKAGKKLLTKYKQEILFQCLKQNSDTLYIEKLP